MTVETDLVDVVGPLLGGRFYPDTARAGLPSPYGIYQQIGGRSIAFYAGGPAPNKKHGRFQINLWAETRLAAAALALQVDDALRAATVFFAEPLGEPTAVYDAVVKLYGTQQDFSIWSDR